MGWKELSGDMRKSMRKQEGKEMSFLLFFMLLSLIVILFLCITQQASYFDNLFIDLLMNLGIIAFLIFCITTMIQPFIQLGSDGRVLYTQVRCVGKSLDNNNRWYTRGDRNAYYLTVESLETDATETISVDRNTYKNCYKNDLLYVTLYSVWQKEHHRCYLFR